MKSKLSNSFMINYLFMFIISTMVGIFSILLLSFADNVLSKTLRKNNYTAESLMQDDYTKIDTSVVVDNGGGVQIIDKDYEIVFTNGLNTLKKEKLTTSEFTDFLTSSRRIGVPYSYSIKYNSKGQFWLIVTFPTSFRIDLAIVQNKDFSSYDKKEVVGAIVAIAIFYILLLTICTVIYSKISSIGIVKPLKKLTKSAKRLKDGDYSTRVDLNLKNEFGELQDTFNEMAERIDQEISLRKNSEDNRKKLILDISHDLKNPLASIMGYAELCLNNKQITKEQYNSYIKTIYNNSIRANSLITDLFELSKMESSEFILNKSSIDVCEYVRQEIVRIIPTLDDAGFGYSFDIPEKEIIIEVDIRQMDRVFQNLVSNSVKYNTKGTNINISLSEKEGELVLIFKDDGIGMPEEIVKDVFNPFVRADSNKKISGTGLGLAIVDKIIVAHGWSIELKTYHSYGCEFIIHISKI